MGSTMERLETPSTFRQRIIIYFAICLLIINCTLARHLPQYEHGGIGNPHFEQDVTFPTFTQLGQISGLAVDKDGKLHVFHRAGRVWDEKSFDDDHQLRKRTIIPNNTITVLDPVTGAELYSWGSNTFYMPHGIFVDDDGNTWITDVGMHQVLKFPAHESKHSLEIGKAFEPGSGSSHFCKPTDVVVTKPGYVFVGDGYCNSRVLVFDVQGKFLQEIGASDGMNIPHSLALVPQYGAICVADRENRRVLCYSSGLDGSMPANILLGEIQGPTLSPIYAIRKRGNQLLAVVGKDDHQPSRTPHGIAFDLTSGTPTAIFQPPGGFSDPHDLAISVNGDSAFVGELDVTAPRRLYKFKIQDLV